MDNLSRISDLLVEARDLAGSSENCDVLRYLIEVALLEVDVLENGKRDDDPSEKDAT